MEKLKSYFRNLFLHEQAQSKEALRVYVVFLLAISIVVVFFGVIYYLLQGFLLDTEKTLIECFYFIWITFSSIGYTDEGFTGSGLVRVITIFVGAYLITRYIVLSAHVYARTVVEEVYKTRVADRMRKRLEKVNEHFLIFGDDRELINKIIQGLLNRGDKVYFISENEELISEFEHQYKEMMYLKTKVFKKDSIDMLRPEAASLAYLLYNDDDKNVLLGALLQGRVRAISRFSGDFSVVPRFERVDVHPISPHFSGGLKMVSTMIR
ncbi:MAG: hypothetical protein U9P14_02895, partial [Gemmatimonadota bacterium]|nr:hypothetical protein [Gemmatimonadota bacterium]